MEDSEEEALGTTLAGSIASLGVSSVPNEQQIFVPSRTLVFESNV